MRWWRWLEPGVDGEPLELEASEAEILEHYFPYWCDRMRAVGKGDQISKAACIEDFVVVNWAWDATDKPRFEDSEVLPDDGGLFERRRKHEGGAE